MNVLVSAGNTLAMIDRVRCITNIFTGRTGASIALASHARGHAVTLLTSHPEAVETLAPTDAPPTGPCWAVRRYHTFEDLRDRLREQIVAHHPDVIVHCAAVSDYLSGGVYAPRAGTTFDPVNGAWNAADQPGLDDRSSGKVKSDEPELWLRLVRAPKLIDRIRGDWGFRGVLVKFKLEVGLSDEALLAVAERSRVQSGANLMVANTLEGASQVAFLGPLAGRYDRVSRSELPVRLLEAVERLHETADTNGQGN